MQPDDAEGADGEPDPGPTRDAIGWGVLAGITLVGAALRLHGLPGQILVGDELYTLWAISMNDLADLPGSVGRFDHSIPLTLVYALIGEITPVEEWMLRAPVVACGLALPPLAFVGARRFVGRDVALLFGLWLAVHPLFVFYARFARPYGIDALLVGAMIVWLDRARASGSRTLLVQTALMGALAAWLHLLALLTAGLVFAGALATAVLDARTRGAGHPPMRAAVSIAAAGVGCLGLVVLLYLPAAGGLADHVFGDKLGDTPLTLRSVWRTLPLIAGLHGWGPGAAFVVLGVSGLAALGRRHGRRALVLLVPALGQPLLVALLEPTKVSYGPVLARYLLFVLPIWMLAICELLGLGAAWLRRRLTPGVPGTPGPTGRTPLGAAAAAFAAAALLVAGPWWTIYTEPTSFAHSNFYQSGGHLDGGRSFFAWPPAHVGRPHPSAVHAVYGTLAADAPLVVEWWPSNDAHYFRLAQAQMVHRQPVAILPFRDFGETFALEHEVALDGLGQLPPGTLVVVHRPRRDGPARTRFEQVEQGVRRQLGAPMLEDDRLLAFEVRARQGTGPGRGRQAPG